MKYKFAKEIDQDGPFYSCTLDHKLYGRAVGFGITKLSALLDAFHIYEDRTGKTWHVNNHSISSIFDYIEEPYV